MAFSPLTLFVVGWSVLHQFNFLFLTDSFLAAPRSTIEAFEKL
jgi:hypothetical protein